MRYRRPLPENYEAWRDPANDYRNQDFNFSGSHTPYGAGTTGWGGEREDLSGTRAREFHFPHSHHKRLQRGVNYFPQEMAGLSGEFGEEGSYEGAPSGYQTHWDANRHFYSDNPDFYDQQEQHRYPHEHEEPGVLGRFGESIREGWNRLWGIDERHHQPTHDEYGEMHPERHYGPQIHNRDRDQPWRNYNHRDHGFGNYPEEDRERDMQGGNSWRRDRPLGRR